MLVLRAVGGVADLNAFEQQLKLGLGELDPAVIAGCPPCARDPEATGGQELGQAPEAGASEDRELHPIGRLADEDKGVAGQRIRGEIPYAPAPASESKDLRISVAARRR